MIGLLLFLQATGVLVHSTPFVPPKTQSARCVGVDDNDQRQILALESRWIPDEHRTALFVLEDSSGTIRKGEWLENQNEMYRDDDRKHGLIVGWDDYSRFSKKIGDQYARIEIQETGISSASILYVVRRYSDRELTVMRHSHRGTIVMAGRCSLFVEGQRRTVENMPRLGLVP